MDKRIIRQREDASFQNTTINAWTLDKNIILLWQMEMCDKIVAVSHDASARQRSTGGGPKCCIFPIKCSNCAKSEVSVILLLT